MKIRFLAPPHHILEVGDQKCFGGQTLEVDDKTAEALIAAGDAKKVGGAKDKGTGGDAGATNGKE